MNLEHLSSTIRYWMFGGDIWDNVVSPEFDTTPI